MKFTSQAPYRNAERFDASAQQRLHAWAKEFAKEVINSFPDGRQWHTVQEAPLPTIEQILTLCASVPGVSLQDKQVLAATMIAEARAERERRADAEATRREHLEKLCLQLTVAGGGYG